MARKTLLHNDAYDKQCSWRERGEQCQHYGGLSPGVVGGPWYCRTHFAQLMGWPSWQATVTDEPMSVIDERVNKIVPRRDGESEHSWSMRCKDWVLAQLKNRVRRREPGEDAAEAA